MKKRFVIVMGLCMTLFVAGCAGQKTIDTSDEQVNEAVVAENGAETIAEISEEEETTSVEENAEAEVDEEAPICDLEDGIYEAVFDTDSSMFRINETCDGKGVLTVHDGKMTIHITLLSKKILNLYEGLAEDAEKEGAVLLEPTIDSVTYSDGLTEEVFGFDVAVPYLDEEFDLALIGEKGKWYDHKVSVSNPVIKGDDVETASENEDTVELSENEMLAVVTLIGGTGKATIESPSVVTKKDDQYYATVVWSSKNYDYMIVNEEKYLNEAEEGEPSVFTIPVVIGEDMSVIGDTVAMSKPHEIEYTLLFELKE